jgi:hypothetical protein
VKTTHRILVTAMGALLTLQSPLTLHAGEAPSTKQAKYEKKVAKYTASGDEYKRLKYEKRLAGSSLSAEDANRYSKLKKQREDRKKTETPATRSKSYSALTQESGAPFAATKLSTPPPSHAGKPPPPPPPMPPSKKLAQKPESTPPSSHAPQTSKDTIPPSISRDDLMEEIRRKGGVAGLKKTGKSLA